MRRELVRLGVALGILIVGFVLTVAALNATLFSASGFVRSYLDALARQDAEAALELAGELPESASAELLTADAMGELADIRLVSSVQGPGGVNTVTFSYSAGGIQGQSSFDVISTGRVLALFPTWEFASSPLGVLQVTPRNDARFIANDQDVTAPAQNVATPYLVFAPTTAVLTHRSTFLEAAAVTVSVTEPAATISASVDVRPSATFIAEVQSQLDDYLDECTTQEVLLPTGCPFGQEIANRIVSTPEWSISQYPKVTIVPGPDASSWLVPRTQGAAHLVVDVRSLFDGTVSTFDEDVPFSASYLITFLPGSELLITAQNG